MNSFSARRKRRDDEETASGADLTTTRELKADHEVTEITVRVRPSQKQNDPDAEFNSQHLRGKDQQVVPVETLVKGYVDPSKGRRVAPRYMKQLTAVVYTNNRSFRTTTVNISVGGAMLKDNLPTEFQYGAIEVLFIHEDSESSQKQYFMFKGEAIKNTGPTSRIQFTSASPAAQETLANLLNNLDPQLIVA